MTLPGGLGTIGGGLTCGELAVFWIIVVVVAVALIAALAWVGVNVEPGDLVMGLLLAFATLFFVFFVYALPFFIHGDRMHASCPG